MSTKGIAIHLAPEWYATAAALTCRAVRAPFVCWMAFAAWSIATTARADTADERFLDGLRERQLFRLAEKYCSDRLARTDLAAEARANLVVELSRCLAEHARNASPAERDALWAQAADVVDHFLLAEPGNPQFVLVQVQSGLVRLAHGETLRQRAELALQTGPALDDARRQLRLGLATLAKAKEEAAVQLRRQNLGQSAPAGSLSAAELAALQRNVDDQSARGFRSQAQCYPPASADRINALQSAIELLAPLAQLDPIDPLAWTAALDEITCHRLLGDLAGARPRIESLKRRMPPTRVLLALRAEELRMFIDGQQRLELQAKLQDGREIAGQTLATLDFARFEACVALWRAAAAAKNDEEAERWQAQAAAMVGQLDAWHGPYWSFRAEAMLAGSGAETPGSDMFRTAEGFYRAGRVDDALAAYDRAYQEAVAAGQAERAFEAAFTAAAIEQNREHFALAAGRFRKLALAHSTLPRAAEAHLAALWNAAQALTSPTDAALDEYAALLAEHLKLWPQSPTASQARLWQARLDERRGKWSEAIAALRGIAPDHPAQAEAVAALDRCYAHWLDAEQAAGRLTAEQVAAAAGYFETVITRSTGRLPERWSPIDRAAALAAARVWVRYAPDRSDRAQRIVAAAIDHSPDAPDEWKQSAGALLTVALAGQSRYEEAAQTAANLTMISTQQRFELVEGLDRLATSPLDDLPSGLALLALQTLAPWSADGGDLSPEQRRRAAILKARALLATEKIADARAVAAPLAKAWPKDAAVQELLIRVLLAAGDPAAVNDALAAARLLEQGSQAGSPRWFRAKYYLASAHERLGNKDRAAKIVSLLQVLHPDLGGPALKPRFEQLLARCQ